jgi:hypothetical protein
VESVSAPLLRLELGRRRRPRPARECCIRLRKDANGGEHLLFRMPEPRVTLRQRPGSSLQRLHSEIEPVQIIRNGNERELGRTLVRAGNVNVLKALLKLPNVSRGREIGRPAGPLVPTDVADPGREANPTPRRRRPRRLRGTSMTPSDAPNTRRCRRCISRLRRLDGSQALEAARVPAGLARSRRKSG